VHSQREALRRKSAGTVDERAQRVERETAQPLLDLQRSSGNAAVARLLQRAPDRPASTDAPGQSGSGSAAPKKAAADIHARVLKYEVDQGVGLITIGSGPDQGVQVGMSGSLLRPNGQEYADFTIESASGRVSTAHVHATADEVNANSDVVIKPASLESQAGKEF
jgi:hypothetical protein